MPWASIAGSVGSALIGGHSARSGAEKQRRAMAEAMAGNNAALESVKTGFSPYTLAGSGAVEKLAGFGDYDPTPTAESVMAQPGYQFGLKSGLDATQGTAAAKGGLYSGAALKALTRYGNDYATTKYNDAWNQAQQGFQNRWSRLSGLAGIGANAQGAVGNATIGTARSNSDLLTGGGNAAAASDIAQGNIWGNALNGVTSAAGDWWSKKTPGGASGLGTAQPYADGGPVRREPVVGTRSPLPSGGGGGLSRESILETLRQVNTRDKVAPEGVAALPANPIMNPKAIMMDREARAYARGGAVDCLMGGGEVDGPGGPTDDLINARLSDGEHVLKTATVNKLGGGSNKQGQKRLMALTRLIDGG